MTGESVEQAAPEMLRSEWHYAVQRLDTLHDEAWSLAELYGQRHTEIWLEVQRLRARIAAIAATGVSFDE